MYVCNSLNRTYMYKHICNYCAISVYIFFFKSGFILFLILI